MVDEVVDVVRRWHEAVDDFDVDGALALCAPDVAVGGPRGEARGHEVMRAWLQRSGIQLEPQQPLSSDGSRVVVHELARWRTTADAPAQAPVDEAVPTWVVFQVRDGLVTAVHRYETAEEVPAA